MRGGNGYSGNIKKKEAKDVSALPACSENGGRALATSRSVSASRSARSLRKRGKPGGVL